MAFYKCKIFVARFAVSCSCIGCESCCIYIAVMSMCADVWLLPAQKIQHEIIVQVQALCGVTPCRNGKHLLTFRSYHDSSKCQ